MKRKWIVILAAALALLVIASGTSSSLAQTEDEAPVAPRPMPVPELAIVAPRRAPAGEEVSMTVFDRQDQDPVKDAGIWALTRENAESLRERIAEIREENENGIRDLDWESLVSGYGFSLGTTQGNGQLKYTFTEEGGYLLIAIKQGYIPGRTFIAIRTIPVALAIQAPRRAPVGEAVTMTVFQRGTEDPVKDAGIWALTRENAGSLRERIAEIREENENGIRDLDWESLVSGYGFSLGTTHGNGQLKYTFTEEGGYLLIAIKQGYIPGRTFIAIRSIPEANVLSKWGRPVKGPGDASGLPRRFAKKPQKENNTESND